MEEIATVTIDVIVRETGRTLCTLQLLETATVRALKAAIIEKRRGAMRGGGSLKGGRRWMAVVGVGQEPPAGWGELAPPFATPSPTLFC